MSKQDKKELRQQIACEWLENNYLNYGSLRHDVVTDRLQIRVANLESSGGQEFRSSGVTSEHLNSKASEPLNVSSADLYWRNLTDKDINTMVCNCVADEQVNINVSEMWTALKSDMVPSVHPIRAWLEGLKPYTPDQPDWIDWLASQVRVRDSASSGVQELRSSGVDGSGGQEVRSSGVTSEHLNSKASEHLNVSSADLYWRHCFKKWFVAMVASWMKDEVVNHTVLVLIGRQGIFKTTWLERLIPPELREYSSKLPLSGQITKDDRLRLCENAMLNIDELDAICGREMNIVKSLLTSTDVNERAAYGRLKERRVRLASFCASTNNREFLTDITGNRRWLPFEVESIQNPFHSIIPYEQIYAQAVYLIEQGWYMYWFDLEEIEELEKHNEEFRAMENEEQLLPILFDIPAEGKGEFMTTAEISDKLVSYGGIKKPMSIRQLGMLLAKRGFQKKQVYLSGSNVRGWIVYKRHTDEIELLKKIDSHSATSQPTNLY